MIYKNILQMCEMLEIEPNTIKIPNKDENLRIQKTM